MLMQELKWELEAADPVFRARVAILANMLRYETIDTDPYVRLMLDDPFQHSKTDLAAYYNAAETARNAAKAQHRRLHKYKKSMGSPSQFDFFDEEQTNAAQRSTEVWMATSAMPIVKNGLDYGTAIWNLITVTDELILEALEKMQTLEEIAFESMGPGESMGLPTDDEAIELCRYRPSFIRSNESRANDRKEAADPEEMKFKSNEAALEYCCRFMDTRLKKDASIAALVLDAKEHLGANQSIPYTKDGLQQAYIRVASDDGGFQTVAAARSSDGPRLKVGDLVMWIPMKYSEEIGRKYKESRIGWVGQIAARIRPTVSIEKGWKIDEMF